MTARVARSVLTCMRVATLPCRLLLQALRGEDAIRLIEVDLYRSALVAEYKPFAAHVLTLNLDDVTYGEIEAIDGQLAMDALRYQWAGRLRRQSILGHRSSY